MTHEEKTISMLKQATGQTRPDFNRFADFISQMNVTMDTGRILQARKDWIPSPFWARLPRLVKAGLLVPAALALVVILGISGSHSLALDIDKAILTETDAGLYEAAALELEDQTLMLMLALEDNGVLDEFGQNLEYEIENI